MTIEQLRCRPVPIVADDGEGLTTDALPDYQITATLAMEMVQFCQRLPVLRPPDLAGRQARWNFCLLASDQWLLDSARIGHWMADVLSTTLDPAWWQQAWSVATREPLLNDLPHTWSFPLAMHGSGRPAGELRPQDLQAVYALYDIGLHQDRAPLPAGQVVRAPEAALLEACQIAGYCDEADNYLPAWFDRIAGPWGVFVVRSGEALE